MEKTVISEGNTTNEAIENGLKILNVSKDMVDIKVLENEDKRSFFSILSPRVVKVELTVKEGAKRREEQKYEKREKEEYTEHEIHEPRKLEATGDEVTSAIENMKSFLKDFFNGLDRDDVKYKFTQNEYSIDVNITGEDLNYLIGYRGDTMNAIQTILTSIASKHSKSKIKVLVDIENYREKRAKSLEDLAEKIAKTVIKTRKSITLEPMTPYERKIIHSKLQNHPSVKTFSTGTEPHRKVVVALK